MSDATPVARVGMRVRVNPVDTPGDYRGEIIRVESLIVDGETWSDGFPTIRLDDGREMTGLECWWTEDDTGADREKGRTNGNN